MSGLLARETFDRTSLLARYALRAPAIVNDTRAFLYLVCGYLRYAAQETWRDTSLPVLDQTITKADNNVRANAMMIFAIAIILFGLTSKNNENEILSFPFYISFYDDGSDYLYRLF